MELKNRRKRKQPGNKERMDPQSSFGFRPPQFLGSFGFPPSFPFMPPPFNQPAPILRLAGPAVRVPEPCFNCLQMGHLKAHCPNKKLYPFSDVLVSSACSSVNGCSDINKQDINKPYVFSNMLTSVCSSVNRCSSEVCINVLMDPSLTSSQQQNTAKTVLIRPNKGRCM